MADSINSIKVTDWSDPKSVREYQRQWHKNRYKTNQNYRKRKIEHAAKWRTQNPKVQRKLVNKYTRNRRARIKLIWKDLLSEPDLKYCYDCKEPANVFHHLNPETKRFGLSFGLFIAMSAYESGWELFLEEWAHTIPLCHKCHGIRHQQLNN